MKKNLLAGVFALTAAFFLTACAASGSVSQEQTKEAPKTAAEESAAPQTEAEETPVEEKVLMETEAMETAAKTATEAEEISAVETEAAASKEDAEAGQSEKMQKKNAAEILADMNVGWNLGNTFDAHGASDPAKEETYWGNPETTKEMIDAVRLQGFNTLRIPVTWNDHLGGAPDYQIDPAWLDRVAEVVDYAYGEGMYVILDTHHEPDYWLKPQTEGLDGVKQELCAIWKQIALRFADYGEKLLFEGMNEPRIKGSAEEWSGGTAEGREAVNVLNAAFVQTVRECGGNNASRCLIICPYGNSATYESITQLAIPADDENIAVSVHLYTPYFFTYEPGSQSIFEWDGTLKKDIASAMDLVDRNLIAKGVPVIVTEFGAVHKTYTDENGEKKDNTDQVVAWLADYMQIANQHGIPCIWWDNGIYDSSGEKFAIFDRRGLTWFSQRIADALIQEAL